MSPLTKPQTGKKSPPLWKHGWNLESPHSLNKNVSAAVNEVEDDGRGFLPHSSGPEWISRPCPPRQCVRLFFLRSLPGGQTLRGMTTWQQSQAAVKAHNLFFSFLLLVSLNWDICPASWNQKGACLGFLVDLNVRCFSGWICLHYFYSYHEWVCTGCFQPQLTFSEIWMLRVSWQRVIGRRSWAIRDVLSL